MSGSASYSKTIAEFLEQSSEEILGLITQDSYGWGDVKATQGRAWGDEIPILKRQLAPFKNEEGGVLFEYTIPKTNMRSDVVLRRLTIAMQTIQNVTIRKINDIIAKSREHSQKSICFVTGVPGAGKTLVGLKLASEHLKSESKEYSTFLSGNQPLVTVLQETLIRDRERQAEYCGFPSEHWTRSRTNNVIERFNREIRRRTRVVGCFPDGTSR